MKSVTKVGILLLSLLFLLSGCLAGKNTTAESDATEEKQELLLWTYYETENQKSAIDELVLGFNASQDLYHLRWEYVGPFTEFNKRLAIGITQNQLPDIVIIDNPDMKRYAEQGVLEDLTDYIVEMEHIETYYSNALESVCFEERYYGIPFCCNNLVLFYNDTLFQEYGLTVPETWDDLFICAQTLTTESRKGFAMSAISGEQSAFQMLSFILSAGDDINALGQQGTVHAFSFIQQMTEAGVMSKDCINWSQNDVARKFIDGECAMMENGPWVLPTLEKSEVDYKIAQLPLPEGVKSELTGVIGGENIGVLKGKNIEGALAFMRYYNESEQMLKTNIQANSLPPRQDVAQMMLEEKPEYKIFEKQVGTCISRTSCKNWLSVTETLSDAQFSVITGAMSPEEAAAFISGQDGDF